MMMMMMMMMTIKERTKEHRCGETRKPSPEEKWKKKKIKIKR
jgi:hypothetical protein